MKPLRLLVAMTAILVFLAGCTGTQLGEAPGVTVKYKPVASASQMSYQFTIDWQQYKSPAHKVLWNFGDGTTDTTEDPTHEFHAKGTQNITLSVTYEGGGSIVVPMSFELVVPGQ